MILLYIKMFRKKESFYETILLPIKYHAEALRRNVVSAIPAYLNYDTQHMAKRNLQFRLCIRAELQIPLSLTCQPNVLNKIKKYPKKMRLHLRYSRIFLSIVKHQSKNRGHNIKKNLCVLASPRDSLFWFAWALF